MDPNQLSGGSLQGGISSRISGLSSALLRHLLALGELAAEETRLLIKQSLTGIFLIAALILFLTISYLAFVAALVSMLAIGCGWSWPMALGAMALLHLVFAGAAFQFLRSQTAKPPFEETAAELRRDLEALNSYSKKS